MKAILQEGVLQSNTQQGLDDEATAFKLFSSVWGVGPIKAREWANQGFRTIDEITSNADIMAEVNTRERAGLIHAHDIAKRIPRTVCLSIPLSRFMEVVKVPLL